MFMGEFTHAVDAKGRVSVPSDLRDVLRGVYGDDRFVVTHGFEGRCLRAYPVNEWKALSDRINAQAATPGTNSIELMQFRRLIYSKARTYPIDKVGRVLIADEHRAHTGIDQQVLFNGNGNFIELWEPTTYEAFQAPLLAPNALQNILASLPNLGL
ncbi:MAG: division/cell wall cluster transcriptional repressor MraZ [Myxococcales bacterium]|nr:division/cell wall cluster transcriptional repressor MraZ [Myxococcales bacterium]